MGAKQEVLDICQDVDGNHSIEIGQDDEVIRTQCSITELKGNVLHERYLEATSSKHITYGEKRTRID